MLPRHRGDGLHVQIVRRRSWQIVNFHIPGDAPDLHSLYLPVLDISMRTITPCKVSFVQHKAIQELCAQSPRIAGALWRHILIDAASCRERMTSIGRRSATCRLAHLLCELVLRYRASGLADGYSIPFPITQAEIGDALGLTGIHVNRLMQRLRKERLISLRSGVPGDPGLGGFEGRW